MISKPFAAAVCAVLLASPALAADLPSRKAPPVMAPIPVMTWNGFYVGLNAGYAWGNANFNVSPGGVWLGSADGLGVAMAGAQSLSLSGGTVSGTVGYNYEFAPFVAGVELDGGWMGLRNSASAGPFASAAVAGGAYGVNMSASSSYLMTLRGRLGYELTPSLLAFVTGGLAGSDVNAMQSIWFNYPGGGARVAVVPGVAGWETGAVSGMRVGWTVGGGLEWMFAPHWSAKIEYLYADFGKQDAMSAFIAPNGALFAADHQFSRNVNVVRAGLNYHFNLGAAPVVAKY